jgi:hypothetical protein
MASMGETLERHTGSFDDMSGAVQMKAISVAMVAYFGTVDWLPVRRQLLPSTQASIMRFVRPLNTHPVDDDLQCAITDHYNNRCPNSSVVTFKVYPPSKTAQATTLDCCELHAKYAEQGHYGTVISKRKCG